MSIQKTTSVPFLVIIAGLLAAFGVAGWTAWRDKSATFDEPLHFMGAWVQTHYDDFRCDPEDPPLWRYYVAAGTSKSELQVTTSGLVWDSMLRNRAVEGLFFKDVLYHTPGNDVDAVIAAARMRMIFIGIVLGVAIAWWAWRLAGPRAAVVACAAFCFDPNFLAHSPLVKNDVPAALALFVFTAAVWRLGQRATALRWGAVSIALAIALTVKFSGILAIPLLAAALALRALLPQPWPVLKWTVHRRLYRLAAACGLAAACYVVAYAAVWSCYGFRYGPSADPGQSFDFNELLQIASQHESVAANHAFSLSPAQQQAWVAHWQPGRLLRLGLWSNQHHLLPQTWIEGFLFTYGTAPGRAGYLLGKTSTSGTWYYFPFAMAVKTPLATLVALLLSAIYWVFTRWPAARWWDIFALSLTPILYLASAMSSDLNLGIRHVLPVYPFIFVFIGITAAHALHRIGKPALILVCLLFVGLFVETCCAYPDFIPFFNIAAGGWRNGPNLLGDSNVDWGQDLPALAQWQRAHPQYQLFLNYFGSADPRYYQIHYVKLPGGDGPEDQSPSSSLEHVYALTANAVRFPWVFPQDQEFYRKLQSRPPMAILGHCIYLYNSP